MTKEILNFIDKNWNLYFKRVSTRKPRNLTSIVITHSHTKNFDKGRIINLIFGENKATPIMVAKFPRANSYETSLLYEANRSQLLNKQLKTKVFPTVYTKKKILGKTVVFEEYVNGDNLSSYIKNQVKNASDIKETTLEVFESASRVLKLFNATRETSNNASKNNEKFQELLRLYKEKPLAAKLVTSYNEALKQILKNKIPIHTGVINYDFVLSNLIESEGETRIIDFEFSVEGPYSFLEPVRFIFYYIETLTELNVLETQDFPTNLGIFCYKRKNWLRVIAEKHFSKFLDFNLLPEYFTVLTILNSRLQNYVAYQNKYKRGFMERTLSAIEGFSDYIVHQIKHNEDTINHLRQSLQEKEDTLRAFNEEKFSDTEKLKELEREIANIKRSLGWRAFEVVRGIKRKISG